MTDLFDADDEAIFDALGNPVRREILRQLADVPLSVAALARSFDISRPAISRHLSVLEQAHLVRHSSEGTRNVYALDREGFARTRGWLDRFWRNAESRLKLLAENTRPKAGAR